MHAKTGNYPLKLRFSGFCDVRELKAGVHLKAVFPPLNLGLMRVSRSRLKQSKNSLLISQIYVLRWFLNSKCMVKSDYSDREEIYVLKMA